jgi:hypothetical protein
VLPGSVPPSSVDSRKMVAHSVTFETTAPPGAAVRQAKASKRAVLETRPATAAAVAAQPPTPSEGWAY